MISRASAVADALDALVDGLAADWPTRPGLEHVYICDGAPVSAIPSPSTVLIVGGGADPEDPIATTGGRTDAGLGRGDDFEAFDITCHLEVWQGGDGTRAVRREAFRVLSEVKAYLQRDPNLGGAVTRARLTGQVDHGTGHYDGDTGAAITFTINCQAL